MQLTDRVEKFLPLAVGALIALGCFFVLKSFLSSILWASILCFTTWPVYVWLLRIVRRPAIAAFIMTASAAVILLLPLLWWPRGYAEARPTHNRDCQHERFSEVLRSGWIRDGRLPSVRDAEGALSGRLRDVSRRQDTEGSQLPSVSLLVPPT